MEANVIAKLLQRLRLKVTGGYAVMAVVVIVTAWVAVAAEDATFGALLFVVVTLPIAVSLPLIVMLRSHDEMTLRRHKAAYDDHKAAYEVYKATYEALATQTEAFAARTEAIMRLGQPSRSLNGAGRPCESTDQSGDRPTVDG